ncbi:glutaredoxin family protein [Allobacillus sp. GCM10007491]|uniref:Glutaredoxin family protein n=1 Tax=Allobacillus saliphilus TaxID=2912308 RepID=A0A941CVU1_9BACI|nr:glutaredoxin family protein [Allobacillus saliphilus]MBR7553125.1 glutaredoxin family protein [Allobacillus saliphilus]
MKDQQITLYSTTTCPVCVMVRDLLTGLSVEYEEIYVDLRPITRMKLVKQTRRLTVPQLNVGGEWVSGFDPIRTLELLGLQSTDNPVSE